MALNITLHLEIARLKASGLSERAIARELDIDRGKVNRALKLQEVKQQVARFQQETVEEHHKVNRQSSNEQASELQAALREMAERQKRWSAASQEMGIGAARTANQWLATVKEAMASNRPLSPKDILMAKLIPAYMRAAAEMVRAGSDAEDKVYAIEEIDRRLNEWNELMGGNGSEVRQSVAGEQ